MITRTKKVFYCEFCGKKGMSSFWIKKHEESCTMNPNRVCKMCKIANLTQRPMLDLLTVIEIGLDELHDAVGGCPCCMLAAIRQSKIQLRYPSVEKAENAGFLHLYDFEFKKARDKFFSKINEDRELSYMGMY